MRDTIRAIAMMTSLVAEVSRKTFIGHVLVAIAGVLAALALALGLRPLINGIYYHDPAAIVAGGITCVLAVGILILSPPAQRAFEARNIELMIKVMEQRVLSMTAGAPGLAHFENPRYWDQLQLLRRNFGELLMGAFGIVVLPVVALQLVIAALVLAELDIRLILLPLVTVPVVWLHGRAQRIQQRGEEDAAAGRRSAAGLFTLTTSAQAASEIRVYGLAPELLALHHDFAAQVLHRTTRATAASAGVRSAGYLLLAAAYTVAVYTVIRSALSGGLSPGDVALTLTLAGVLIGAAMVSSQFSAVVARAVLVARSYDHLAAEIGMPAGPAADRAESRAAAGRAAAPLRMADGFILDDISFAYPASAASGRQALAGVTAHLPAGAVVALVGENGAGKTTLVKLLSRMYEPDAGRILLDGCDIRDYAVEHYRRRLSASFQDYVRFELSVRRSVGIGDLDRMGDESAVSAALGKARCDFVSELPRGLSTRLGKDWAGGVELSGGQWQKLAIARAMMRNQALLVVFDEPTASLDPQSEYEIFQQVAAEARAGQQNGRITLLVSHRFSTVRMADLILVLDHGTVAEQGTHEQLVGTGGLYAELYRLQAQAYAR